MNSDQSLTFLKDLVKIPSVSGNEQAIARFLTSFLTDYNFQILPSKVGNVIGVKGKGSPVLLLSSHMDTVRTNNPFREDEKQMFGTGIVDCKASLASMMLAAATVPWTDDLGTLIVSGVVHEEDSLLGIEDLFQTLDITPDFAIFGEPTQNDRICLGYRGRVWTKLSCETDCGHTACAWDFDNAIDNVYTIYSKIKNFADDFNKKLTTNGEHFYEISVNISTMHAGVEANSLPRDCSADVDIRIPPQISAHAVVDEINRIISQYSKERELKSCTMLKAEIMAQYNACDVTPSNPVVNSLRWAIFQTTKRKVDLIRKTGSSFTNMIQDYYSQKNPKFACITYGPGNPRLEHTDNEVLVKAEFLETLEVYQKFFPKLKEFYLKSLA